jgi:hypothetical protein
MRVKILRVVRVADIPKKVCNNLIGEHHTSIHRMTAGAVIMVVGVTIAKLEPSGMFHILHYTCDIVGYALHGLGTVPFIDALLKGNENEHE